MRRSIVVTLVLFACSSAMGADILIKNARLVTLSAVGTIESGDLLVRDGVIAEIGSNISANGVETVDVDGAWVTPGLFDSSTQLGLGDVESSSVRSDQRVSGTELGAGFQVALAFNRFSDLKSVTRAEGVTRVVVRPRAGSEAIAGQSAVVHLGDGDDALIDASNAVIVELGEDSRGLAGGSRAATLASLVNALEEARLYMRNERAIEAGRFRALDESVTDLRALVPVLEGDKPLAVVANRASDIEMAIQVLAPFELDLVIIGGREAWKVTNLLVEYEVPVILAPMDNLPYDFDRIGARLDSPALLNQAGVTIAFMTDDLFSDLRSLSQGAGVAVANGLPWYEALRAITINPARIWGVADSFGSLAPGIDADIVIWDGDPLEVTSAPSALMIRGQWMSLENRLTKLRDRYRNPADRSWHLTTGQQPTQE